MTALKQILVVGDSALRDTAKKLDGKRYESYITSSTQEAKALIQHHQIDLVISDYSLSKRRLISLQRQVKKNKGTVIIYTGDDSIPDDRHETGSVERLAAGELCITKDLRDLQSLPQVIEQALFNPEDYFTFEEPAQPHVVAILEATSDFIGTMDIDGFFIYLNQTAKDLLDIGPYGAEKPIRLHDILDAESATRLRKVGFVAAMTDGTWRDINATLDVKLKNFPATLQLIAHRDEDGNLTHFSTIVRDVTDIRDAEQERLNLLAQLQEAQKMESIGELSAALAHNFGNILSGIMGYAELGLKMGSPTTQLERIVDTCTTGSSIVKQLMTVTKPEKRNSADINANQLLTEIKDLLQTVTGNHVTMNLQLEQDLRSVALDTSTLQQIILNLCANARDAIKHAHGEITISTRNCDDGPDGAPEGVRIRFIDNGIGMTPETQEKLFQPFYSTKGDKGTGLGLSYVHDVITEAGGTISVTSKEGRGTMFDLFVPTSPCSTEHRQPGASHQEDQPGHSSFLH